MGGLKMSSQLIFRAATTVCLLLLNAGAMTAARAEPIMPTTRWFSIPGRLHAHGIPGAALAADVAPVQNVAQGPVHTPWLPPRL